MKEGGNMAIGNNKLNNKGMSLVEILVTIAMVVIIAGPLINSFLNSRIVNSNAQVIQNGTVVAQDIVEEFKAKPLAQLLEEYEGKYTLVDGVYKFTGLTATGAGGEDYDVEVSLDPSTYTRGDLDDSGDKLEVNNVQLPGMSSIYGSEALKLYKYYVAADDDLQELFRTQLGADSAYVYTSLRPRISKHTDIMLRWVYKNNRYEYDIILNMTYTYKSNSTVKSVVHTEELKDIIMPAGQPHLIYLVCPVFDICSTTTAPNDQYYASDSIRVVSENADGLAEDYPDIYFYLAEQETYNRNNAAGNVRQILNPTLINIDDITTYATYNPTAVDQDIIFCSNVQNPDNANALDLTYSDKNSGVNMYEIKVNIKFKGKQVAEFKSAK